MCGLSLGTRLPNLKFVPSAVLELLAFNAPKFPGSRNRDHAHFSGIFVRVVWTIPANTPAKFEVRTFTRFGADRQTTDRPEEAYQWAWLMVTTPTCWTHDTRHRRKTILESSNVLLTQCIGQTITITVHAVA